MMDVRPTRFDWLTGFAWRPVGVDFGMAILDLAEPGVYPPSAWEPVCGPLVVGPTTPDTGPVTQGLVERSGTPNRAAVYLTTDLPADDPAARVSEVRIRVEPA